MVSSVTSNAAFSTAMLSGSQCRGTRDPQAFQEKLFSKLDVNGDGGIDQSELTQFVDFASSSTTGTGSASDSAGADLFKAMDMDGDGTLSKTEVADGTKKLFEELRTQLMTASGGTSSDAATGAEDTAATSDATQSPPPPPPGGHHHGGGGMFAKIASLLDQYRSTATTDTAATTTETSTLSVAA
jgi:hypothetical protein